MPPTYAEEVLADAPLLYYRFGETAGATVAKDSSPNGRDGTYVGAPALGVAGALSASADKAVSLDGVDDRINLPVAASLAANSSITLEWWQFYATADLKDGAAFCFGTGGAPNRCLCHCPLNAGNKTVYWDYGDDAAGGRVTADYTPYLDKWTHCVLTFDKTTGIRTITFDGVQVATATSANAPVATISGGAIGGFPAFGYFNKQRMDEFAIYGTALTLARRQAHYAARAVAEAGAAPGAANAQRLMLDRRRRRSGYVPYPTKRRRTRRR
jgi:hypothetical protein